MSSEAQPADTVPTVEAPVEVAKPKRRPGRPPKTIESQTIEILGIVEKPEDPEDYMELVYDNPTLFKDLMKLFGHYNVSDIDLAFLPTTIEIDAKGPSRTTVHRVVIDCRGLNHYYCREPIRSCISIAKLDNILFGGNKNYHKITIIAQQNFRAKLRIVLHNVEYNVDEIFDIDVSHRPQDNSIHAMQSDEDYPVRFTMQTSYFNAALTKLRKFGTDAVFQKIGEDSFEIKAFKDKQTTVVNHYRDNKVLDMVCTLEPSDILSVTVPIDYILPLAKANISKNITVALSKTKNISMTTNIAPSVSYGNICCIKIFAEIRTTETTT